MPGSEQRDDAVDPSSASSQQEFAQCLKALWIRADSPSYRRLGDWARKRGKSLSRTALSDVLNGKSFPRKSFLFTFIEACGVDPALDGRWERVWNRLASDLSAARGAQDDPASLEELQQSLHAALERAGQLEAELRSQREDTKYLERKLSKLEERLHLANKYLDLGLRISQPDVGAKIIEAMTPCDAAESMARMSAEDSLAYLMVMDPEITSRVLGEMDADRAAERLASMPTEVAASLLHSDRNDLLQLMNEDSSVRLLAALEPSIAAAILVRTPAEWAAQRLEKMSRAVSARILGEMPQSAATAIFNASKGEWVMGQFLTMSPLTVIQIFGSRNESWKVLTKNWKSEQDWESEAAEHLLDRHCPGCGRKIGEQERFCGHCGTALPAVGTAAALSMTGEERRHISVLFVDLIDFTPYVERADPELVRGVQTSFFSAARQVVGQYGGVVEKYIGDAVMALFGAPVATETDPLRCVSAGLELQRVLAGYAPAGADELRFRVGVATGEALVDVAAGRDGGQAIVAGDVVNTAARMQSVAPPGGVLVCGNTYALTKNAIRYAEQPAVTLRGRSTPAEVWLALEPVRRPHPDREPDSTPLIDREHELGLLVNALHRSTRDRVPQVVTLFGRAGIGKSRLIRELYRQSERLIDAPLTWHTGRCPPFGENVTFAALADIVKAEAGILDTDPANAAARRLTEAVRELVGPTEADRLVDALRPLVGLASPALPAEETESAWRRFLVALAVRRPTVLVFEDLHWADEPMLRFVELLGTSARDVPLLLLCTARPELVDRDPSWAGTITGSVTITLPPLRDTGIASLLTTIFGDFLDGESLDQLVELAGGNPLYAHEYVRMLMEQGTLGQSGRGWSLEKQTDLPMPDSVHAVIANRVDLLDAKDRTVLLAASVVGMQFWPGAVAAALGQPVESVERALRRLEQRDFVHEQSGSTMAGQAEFRFRHVLVRDVCYQRLPRGERVARHERTADWLDALSRTRDTDLAEVLAHHRWAAHEIARSLDKHVADRYVPAAREALHRAARRAYALHALDTAAGHASRALALDNDSDPVSRLQLELLSSEIAFYRDSDGFLSGGGVEQLAVLADRLLTHDDSALAARAWTLLGQAAWMRTDRATALSCLRRAVELSDPLPDSAQKADAYAELARLHMLNYERDPAISAAGVAVRIAERLGLTETQTNARITAATARYQAGDRAGLDELHAIVRFCHDNQLLARPRAVQNLAYAIREEGDWIRSNDLLSAAPQHTASAQPPATSYSIEATRAYFDGEFTRLLEVADTFVDTPTGGWDMQVRGLRACLRILRDEPVPGERPGETSERTADDITDALAVARGSGFHRVYWTTLGVAALCRALQGRGSEATALIGELVQSWSTMPVLASGEWVTTAAYAASLSGRRSAIRLRDMLLRVTHRTAWVQAALVTVTAALAAADGDHHRAGELHLAAADSYARIPDTTDRFLALALAAAELSRSPGHPRTAETLAEVRAFALRNKAPGLLRLASPSPPAAPRQP